MVSGTSTLTVPSLFRLLSLIALLATGLTPTGNAQQTGGRSEQALSRDVLCVLAVDSPVWQPGKPARISVRLENLTDRDLKFETVPEFDLSGFGTVPHDLYGKDDYSAPTNIVENKPIKTRKVGSDGMEPVPIKVRLAKNSVSVFQVDAAATLWQRTISSNWPNSSLSIVPPGPYSLRLEFSISGNLVRSNRVKIVIGEKVPSQH